MDVTGRRTVPQVFIGSKFVGGCDGESCLKPLDTYLQCCAALRALPYDATPGDERSTVPSLSLLTLSV